MSRQALSHSLSSSFSSSSSSTLSSFPSSLQSRRPPSRPSLRRSAFSSLSPEVTENLELRAMDNNSQRPAAPPAATMGTVLQGSSSQQTTAIPARAAATHGPIAQPGTAVPHPRPPSAVRVPALRPVHQHLRPRFRVSADFRRPKLRISRPPAPAATVRTANLPPRTMQVAGQQHLQGSSSQMMAALAAPGTVVGVGRPLAPATVAMLANSSPRFMQVDRLTLRDLQGSKLPVFRGPPPPRPELAGSVSGNALLQSSSSDIGPCVLNKQAGPPSPEYVSSETDSDSEDELVVLVSDSDNDKL